MIELYGTDYTVSSIAWDANSARTNIVLATSFDPPTTLCSASSCDPIKMANIEGFLKKGLGGTGFVVGISPAYEGPDQSGLKAYRYVKSVYVIHVGGTLFVISSTDNIMNIQARITWTVEFIRGCIFLCLLYVEIQGRVGSILTFFSILGTPK